MSQELPLGQREVGNAMPIDFTADELDLLKANNVTPEEVSEFVRTSGPQSIDAAIGGVTILKSGQGQVRNEPFQTQAEADSQVSGQ